jgi:hypothetical protein
MAGEKEKVAVTGEKLDGDKKLGPSVTYIDHDKSARLVTVAGVPLRDGESVNLEDALGPERAKGVLQKLAGNPYFEVQGGPKAERRLGTPEELGVVAPLAENAIRTEQQARLRGEEPPEDYDAPVAAVLERPKLPGRK